MPPARPPVSPVAAAGTGRPRCTDKCRGMLGKSRRRPRAMRTRRARAAAACATLAMWVTARRVLVCACILRPKEQADPNGRGGVCADYLSVLGSGHMPSQLFLPRRQCVWHHVQSWLCQQWHRLHPYARAQEGGVLVGTQLTCLLRDMLSECAQADDGSAGRADHRVCWHPDWLLLGDPIGHVHRVSARAGVHVDALWYQPGCSDLLLQPPAAAVVGLGQPGVAPAGSQHPRVPVHHRASAGTQPIVTSHCAYRWSRVPWGLTCAITLTP
jgi:predicted nucleic acid-binding Zn ribbon protein